MRIASVQHEWARTIIRHHPAHLSEAYPARWVNNVYLDTLRRSHYVDHVNGVGRRKKVRIRWYGELDGDLSEPQLEIKSKDGWTGVKQIHRLPHCRLDQLLTSDGIRSILTRAKCPPAQGEMVACLEPSLINRYHRRYFQTRDGQARITVDSEMRFHHADRFTSGSRTCYTDRAVIVEIKYPERSAAMGTAVAAHFPLPLSKNSKYVSGIQLLHGM